MPFKYVRYAPSQPLSIHIDHFYYLEGGLPNPRADILPMPWCDLKINLGGALRVFEVGHPESVDRLDASWCVGIWDGCHTVDWPNDLRLFGICFRPDGAYPLLQVPLDELRNQVAPLDTIWGRYADDMREQLRCVPTIQAGFALLEQLLLVRLSGMPDRLRVVQQSVAEITRRNGALSIRALSEQVGISQKHLITQFKRMVGVSPKEFASFVRLRHMLRSIDATDPRQSVDWALLARQCGFYDQAHLSNTFMTHLGYTPDSYRRLRSRAQLENPRHAQLFRNLPTG